MSNYPLILLPPSESKASGGEAPSLNLSDLSFPEFEKQRELMTKTLIQMSKKPRVAQKTLGVKGAALDKARADNASLNLAPTMPAIERYTGVMYDFINYQSLDEQAQSCFAANAIIFSGLYGTVRPFDLIPNYKLKMGARIRLKKTCAAIWKPLITSALASVAKDRVVWDLLPNEHSVAWDPDEVSYAARFTVKFLEDPGDGKLRTLNHWSKAMKGALIRYLVSNPDKMGSTENAFDSLKEFQHPQGYEFRQDMTTQSSGVTELVFLKET